MIKLVKYMHAYLKCERGATAIEYGLIAAFIALAISGAVYAFGGELTGMFESFEGMLTNPGDGADGGGEG
ncbi:MAG: Flp family type IVb pilin [Micavibrio sp.]|nr:Flp family type IVb pilin [Micavibrio sp.]